jgi:hypothetical protein
VYVFYNKTKQKKTKKKTKKNVWYLIYFLFPGVRDGDKLVYDYQNRFGSVSRKLGKPFSIDEHLSSIATIRFVDFPSFKYVKLSPKILLDIAKNNKYNNREYSLGSIDCHAWATEALHSLSKFRYY